MKCPLLNPEKSTNKYGVAINTGDCLKADCAWWEMGVERCAVLDLAHAMDGLKTVLEEICDSLPGRLSS